MPQVELNENSKFSEQSAFYCMSFGPLEAELLSFTFHNKILLVS